MKWKANEVAEIFSVRDFTRLCCLVDQEQGKTVKFDIVGMKTGDDGKLEITIMLDGGKRTLIKFNEGTLDGRHLRAETPVSLPTTSGQGTTNGAESG